MPRKKEQITEAYYFDFPKRLRFLMLEQNKTQQDVATAIGKTRQAIGYYADGSSSPDWRTIVKLADFFKVSTDFILGKTDILSTNMDIQDVIKVTGLSEQSVKNLCLVTSNLKRNNEMKKALFVQLLLENEDIWEQLSVCAFDYRRHVQMDGMDSFHTVEGIPRSQFANVAKGEAKEALSNLFKRIKWNTLEE